METMGLHQSPFTQEQLTRMRLIVQKQWTVSGEQDSLEAARVHGLLCTKTVSAHEITMLVSPFSLSWWLGGVNGSAGPSVIFLVTFLQAVDESSRTMESLVSRYSAFSFGNRCLALTPHISFDLYQVKTIISNLFFL